MQTFLEHSKEASRVIATLDPKTKCDVLLAMADALEKSSERIIHENQNDLVEGEKNGLSAALMDRLLLNPKRIAEMAKAIREIAALKEPVGRVLEGWVVPSGLRIEKVSIPIGVVAIIYESRPNVTSDTAALCFKSGNACVLKGGKEAHHSNTIIATILQEVLEAYGLPKAIISLLPDASREGVAKLIKMDKYVDVIIPRGGEALIRYVSENATIPVVKHDKGVCHTFVDKDANLEQAIAIVLNAKCQRPSACNALETLLVHKAIASTFLPPMKEALDAAGAQMKGCEHTQALLHVSLASDEDYHTEHLRNALNIKIVADVDEAIAHIARYGSSHSEAILSENYTTAERFLNEVDAASVYVNASTRFTDGGEFGFGAEVGISTNKLHARGPMGINDLTTYKFKVYGKGQIRT
ncbi:glutamate-5-semialdehyde dehydrogenase [Sulfurospirillum deleyianum]|uniref:Gamma-glutamyl phosphate reductase n=1 Tax=Sulfurospirillum deleyianum (strain ATCC 51133 / DSM 6946 / 5175) TaxID=525898 RepID=D1B2L2_SULD5|nr:glutamate-5-semialdehyde dehydrogenase [Sulfurospirillum deleyianum]ACZ12332.1 gamma-glutamyl phosphate reductase [Sulfurospirillum deleyianum DSM 6946]